MTAIIVIMFAALLIRASIAEAKPIVPVPMPPSDGAISIIIVEARWLSPSVLEARERGMWAAGMPLEGVTIRWADLTGCDVQLDCVVEVHEAQTNLHGLWAAGLDAGSPWMVSATQPAFLPDGWCRSGVDTWRIEVGSGEKYRFLVEFWGDGCF